MDWLHIRFGFSEQITNDVFVSRRVKKNAAEYHYFHLSCCVEDTGYLYRYVLHTTASIDMTTWPIDCAYCETTVTLA